MLKKYLFIILIIVILSVSVSGCTTKTAANGTFGEKYISVNSIYIADNATSGNFTADDGTEYYYMEGYVTNNNQYDAFHVIMNATAYDANGNIVGLNNSAYLEPSTIPGKGASYFYVDFNNSANNIVKVDVKVVDAKGTI